MLNTPSLDGAPLSSGHPLVEAVAREIQRTRAFSIAWERLIPKCAKQAAIEGQCVVYLHPTKGWRRVSLRRFYVYA